MMRLTERNGNGRHSFALRAGSVSLPLARSHEYTHTHARSLLARRHSYPKYGGGEASEEGSPRTKWPSTCSWLPYPTNISKLQLSAFSLPRDARDQIGSVISYYLIR